ncbi:MAG: class I SAM-dependent methyltransferase [Rhodospirillales bacterium]|jgi:SAM-dependent methyltransferase|nr:class I SAM-dependent methyltransferase [Rhodospirillales bacterium]
MAEREEAIEAHYAIDGLAGRMLAAIDEAGLEGEELTPEILAPMDHQLHGGGLGSTVSQAGLIEFNSAMKVLDVGCGVGGPARYLAKTFGCRVTGLDLTAEFIEAARALNERAGLSHLVDFQIGDGGQLPFADESFDLVWCQNVIMNIADKAGFMGEIHRVLKAGGRHASSEVVLGPVGDPYYPVMWARQSSISFLNTPAARRAQLDQAGFEIEKWREGGSGGGGGGNKPPASPLPSFPVLGDDVAERSANTGRNIAEGRLGGLGFVARKSGS